MLLRNSINRTVLSKEIFVLKLQFYVKDLQHQNDSRLKCDTTR